MYKEIIEKENLSCTEQEFETFYNSIYLSELEAELNKLTPTIYSFDEKYNWVEIENPANWEVYYTIEVDGRMFLQNIVPYIWGLIPITKANVNEVIKTHKDTLIKEYITWEKVWLTIKHFKKFIKNN